MHQLEVACCNGKKFSIKATGLLHKSRSAYQDIAIYNTEEFGRCLFLDGVIQCSESDHAAYDRALLKRLRPTDRRLLILGGGDGYTAELALQLDPALEITVVDLDAEVVAACRQHLGQQVFADPRLQLVIADALKFMEQVGNAGYDGVVCDLTDFPVGYNDGAFREFYATVFPLARKVLKDDGWLGVYAGSRDAVGNGGLPVTAELAELLTTLFARVERIATTTGFATSPPTGAKTWWSFITGWFLWLPRGRNSSISPIGSRLAGPRRSSITRISSRYLSAMAFFLRTSSPMKVKKSSRRKKSCRQLRRRKAVSG